jgi:putative FmdB family regulatory protein
MAAACRLRRRRNDTAVPLYEYRCQHCGHLFEQLVRAQPGPGVLECPKCGETTAVRQWSRFASGSSTRSACAPAGG